MNDRDDQGKFTKGNLVAYKTGAYSTRLKPSIRGVRALNKHLAVLQGELEAAVEETPKTKVLIGQVVRLERQICLIEMYLKKHGILRPVPLKRGLIELQPALSNCYVSFLNSQRLALRELELKELDHALTLEDYIEQKDKEEQ